MSVLEFVESSEFRKTRAKQVAQALVAEIGLDALVDGGDGLADDLLAVLAEDLAGLAGQASRDAIAHAVAMGFDEIDAVDAAATLRGAIERVLAAAAPELRSRLAALVATLDAMIAGSSVEAVQASLASEAVRTGLLGTIGSFLASTAAGVIQAVEAETEHEAAAAMVEKAQQGNAAPPLLEWQTREDDNVCGPTEVFEVSCSARHGKQLTWEEWEVFGFPGSADAPTICAVFAGPGKSKCRCTFIPAGSAASTPTPVRITDAAKAGRERALKEAA